MQTRNDDEKLIVAVSDTGVGISEADFPHIFDRFYRTESAQIASKSGSGLGLAIVKKIITMHGGEVLASKRHEQGTTFEIRMPVLESPEGQ